MEMEKKSFKGVVNLFLDLCWCLPAQTKSMFFFGKVISANWKLKSVKNAKLLLNVFVEFNCIKKKNKSVTTVFDIRKC